jgi:hypothetical protein
MSSERDSFAKGIFSTFAKGFLLHKLLLKVNYSPLRVKKSRSHEMGHCAGECFSWWYLINFKWCFIGAMPCELEFSSLHVSWMFFECFLSSQTSLFSFLNWFLNLFLSLQQTNRIKLTSKSAHPVLNLHRSATIKCWGIFTVFKIISSKTCPLSFVKTGF